MRFTRIVATACASVAIATAACSPSEIAVPDTGPTSVAAPEELLFADGTTLRSFDLAVGETGRVAALPSRDVAVSSDGELWAAVQEGDFSTRAPGGGFNVPQVVTARVDGTGRREVVGPGYSPTWSPGGDHIAAIVTVEGYLICDAGADRKKARKDPEGEGCVDGQRVVTYDVAERSGPEVAIGAGVWSIAGWTDRDRIVAESLNSQVVKVGFAGAVSEEQTQLPFVPGDISAVSPQSLRVLGTLDGEVVLWDAETESTIPVELAGRVGTGAWSPDGGSVVATVTGEGLVMIDAASGEVTSIPDSDGATGDVVWAPGSSHFAYQRSVQKRGADVMLCSARPVSCEEAFTFERGIRLLALS